MTREEIHTLLRLLHMMKRDEDTDKIYSVTIMAERDSQKGIVIGKQGSMLKKIGKFARKDIEVMSYQGLPWKPGLLRKLA